MNGKNLSVTSELINGRAKFECSAPGRESIDLPCHKHDWQQCKDRYQIQNIKTGRHKP